MRFIPLTQGFLIIDGLIGFSFLDPVEKSQKIEKDDENVANNVKNSTEKESKTCESDVQTDSRENDMEYPSELPNKKRKRRGNLESSQERHLEISSLLLDSLKEASISFSSLSIQSSLIEIEKEKKLGEKEMDLNAKSSSLDLIEWGEMVNKTSNRFGSNEEPLILDVHRGEGEDLLRFKVEDPPELFNRIVENPSQEEAILLECMETTFKIPPNSSFLMGDISKVRGLLKSSNRGSYNTVVMDPPWENKSVERSKKYPTLPNYSLFSIPLPLLIDESRNKPNVIVAVWVTNKEKFFKFVKEDLFSKWNVEFLSVWYWIKIKNNGELVSSLDSLHRRPYEPIILGRTRGINEEKRERMEVKTRFIFGVPSSHSRKPYLGNFLMDSIGRKEEKVIGLELFARDLREGWTSFGNEAILFSEITKQ